MDANQSNDTVGREFTVAGGIYEGDRSPGSGARKVGEYSYRLVHTQESLRLLDLRLNIAELAAVEDIGVVLDGVGRKVLSMAIMQSLSLIDEAQRDNLK